MPAKGSIQCPACGMTLLSGAQKCRYCGYDLAAAPPVQKKKAARPDPPAKAAPRLSEAPRFGTAELKKWLIVIAVGIVAVVGFFFVKDVIFDRSESDKARSDMCTRRCSGNRDTAISVGDLPPGENKGFMDRCMDSCVKTGKAPMANEP